MIREASASDSGVYVCNATNKFGFDTRSGTLNVKRKTRIQTRPGNQEVRRGYYAIFRCTAIADTSLTYDIEWYKDGRPLSYTGTTIFFRFELSSIYSCWFLLFFRSIYQRYC